LGFLNRHLRYQAHSFIKSNFSKDEDDTVETRITNATPLADDHLKQELVKAVWSVWQQAQRIEAAHGEVRRTQNDLENLHNFSTPPVMAALRI
jgi:hypothetical protein